MLDSNEILLNVLLVLIGIVLIVLIYSKASGRAGR